MAAVCSNRVAMISFTVRPRELRPLLVEFVEQAQRILATLLGPAIGIAY